MSRIEKNIVVSNKLGLHARPASKLVKVASGFDADVSLIKDGELVDCKSVLAVLTLAAGNGTKLRVVAEGAADAPGAADAVANLFANKFGEEE